MPSQTTNRMDAARNRSPASGWSQTGRRRPVASEQAGILLPSMTDLALQWIKDGENGAAVVEPHSPTELEALLRIDFPLGDGTSTASSSKANGAANGSSGNRDEEGIQRILAAARPILRYSVNHWTEGRFAAKLYSSTDAAGLASELLLAVLNANAHVFSAAPALSVIEITTVRKINDLIGFGKDAGGLTMPGGSASNRLSLTTAINNLLPSVQRDGLASLPFTPVILTSEHSHYSVEQAAISAGLGLKHVIRVGTDGSGRMDVSDLRTRLEASRQAGQRPFYINVTAGTTVTGCFDNIRQAADLARQYDCWLHVDGSWGGSVLFSDRYRSLLDGIELAHSVTINPHKGLRVPLQCSFLLVRDRRLLSANVVDGDYLFHGDAQQYDLGATTTFCGRRSDALKMYLAWQMHGSRGLAAMIDDALDSGKVIRAHIRAHPNLQLILPRDEGVLAYSVCFRYRPTSALYQGSLPSRAEEPARRQSHSQDKALRRRGPTPRLMVRPIHAEVLKRGKVMVDFAPIRVRVAPSSAHDNDNDDELDADENGFIGEVFRLPLHPYGLEAGLSILDEIVEVGDAMFGNANANGNGHASGDDGRIATSSPPT